MDAAVIIVSLSFILQLVAAFFAVRLLLWPGRRIAGLITLAIILLMAFRRLVPLSRLIAGDIMRIDPFAEGIALTISLLLLTGILYLSRLIQSERKMASMLSDSRQHYMALFNQSPDGVLLIDMNGHILDFNETAAKDLGYTREEFSSLHLSDIDPVETRQEIQKSIEDVFNRGKAEFEVKHRTKGGDLRDVYVITQLVEIGRNKAFHTIWRDITERKKADTALRESRARLSRAQAIAHVGDWEWDVATGVVRWSDELYRIYGYEPGEIPPDYGLVLEKMHPESKEEFLKAIEAALREDRHFEMDYRFFRKEGSEAVLHTIGKVIREESGAPLRMIGIVQEITERIAVERRLRESEDRFRSIFEQATDGIMIADHENKRIIEANKAICTMVGYGRDELLTFRVEDLHPKADLSHILDLFERQGRGEISLAPDVPMLRKDGSVTYVDINAAQITLGGRKCLIGIFRDITERKRVLEMLHASEERFRSMFDNSPVSLWEEDFTELYSHLNSLRLSGVGDIRAYFIDHPEEVGRCVAMVKIMAINKSTLMIYRAKDETALMANLSAVFTPESLNAFREILIALYQGAAEFECETVNLTLGGKEISVLLRWTMLPENPAGRKRALISVVDITDHKRAEEKIRQSEQFIRDILDTVDEGFIVIDRDYRILTANKAYCSQVGESPDLVIGRHCFETSHRALRPCFEEGEDCAVRRVFETGEPHVALHKHRDAKGSILYVETKAFPIRDSSGAVISAIETVNNITEKHLLEEERLKTQKLEAIGTLAGGIAHDFNNLLQGIFGYISMAKMTIADRERALVMLNQAEQALHMSVNLTTQLLTFSKGGKPVMKNVRLKPLIENSARFALSGSRVDYSVKLAEDLWTVKADEGQIGQVIQNIVLNADQAMPGGGTIVISGRNIQGEKKRHPQLTEDRYVEISVQDSGIGIPGNYLQKIFDPYFTTKEKGSGLGLATSYSIVKNHGGLIDAVSEPGKGTTFFVYLPALEFEEEIEKTTVVSPRVRYGKILVMDDEELVRNIAGSFVRALGHEADVAEDGDSAIAKYQTAMESGRPFDVVILDLTVRGGLGGKETMERLRAVDPHVKAIVSSGFSDDDVVANYRNYGFAMCLTKPYDMDDLKEALNALLKNKE